MAKKLIVTVMAITAMAALAVPAMASASKIVFEGTETLVPTGQEITGTSNVGGVAHPLVTTTETLGTLACEKIMLGGTLNENNGSSVKGTGTEAQSSTSGCKFNGETAANVVGINLSSIASSTSGTGTFTATFRSEIPGGVVCNFETKSAGTFTYTSGSNIIKVAKTTLKGGACGTSSIEGEVELDVHRAGPPEETLAIELK